MIAFLTRLRMARMLLKSGPLLLRLVRDPRVPALPKLALGAAALYAFSPLDFIPDVVPLLGQLDDMAVLALGLRFFFQNVPAWLKAEHEAALGQTSDGKRVIDQ